MKTLFKIFTMALILGFASQAFAKDGTVNYQVAKKGAKSMALFVENLPAGELNISIVDKAGHKLFQQKVKELSKYAKAFNLEHLPNGAYRLIIEQSDKTWIQPISIEENELYIKLDEQQEIRKPNLVNKGAFVDFRFELKQDTDIDLNLSDDQGYRLYEESIDQENKLGRRFDVTALPVGTYYITVAAEGKYFRESFVVGR